MLGVWGAISWFGKSKLVILDIEEQINSKLYCDLVLGKAGLALWKKTKRARKNTIWQDDGARYHISKATTAYREKLGIKRMKWPAQSSDLNPIENIWHLMKLRISKQRHQIHNKEEMKKVLQEEWDNIPLTYICKLISGMSKRRAEVIKQRDGSTHY